MGSVYWHRTEQNHLLGAGIFYAAPAGYRGYGMVGGLINNPFRITDNFNRFLLFLKLLLLPGRLVAQAIMNFINLIAENKY